MTYRWLQDLDQALRARGVEFTEYGDWKNCGRPYSTGNFDPQGVLCHHTASPNSCSSQDDIDVIMAGNSSAPGPISQLYIGRSGDVYILAAGRANHGGKGRRPGIDVGGCADMNAALLGIEVGASGSDYWPDIQTEAYGEVVFALCDWYGWDVNSAVFLHATTGPPDGGCNSKIDPSGPWQCQVDLAPLETWDLDVWRAWCLTMGGQPSPGPSPQPPQPQPGGDDMPQPCGYIQCNQGTKGHHVDGSEWEAPIDGTLLKVNSGGTIQWVHAGEKDDCDAVMVAAGQPTNTWDGAVGTPDAFGRLVGDKPHM